MGKNIVDKLLEDEFYDIPFEMQQKYMDLTTAGLLNELDSITERTEYEDEKTPRYSYVETTYTDNKLATTLALLICERLGLFRGHDLLQIINKLIYENKQEVKNLEEKFKNHRHPLNKTYGEKPIW